MVKEHKVSVVGRYEKVIGTLFKYGFEDIVAHPPFSRFLTNMPEWVAKRDGKLISDYTRYERIRMVCEDLGTTFIKFAQIASNRPDLLPEDLIAELEKFQEHARPVPVDQIKEVLLDAYKKPIHEVFQHFEEVPIASASIAQVHRAVLKTGEDVVLKIQRPGIEDIIEADIAILKQLADIMEKYFPKFHSFQPVQLVKVFEKSIRKELKFSIEANNLQRFTENFKGHKDVYIPKLYPKYTTNKVLCMEYIDGMKCTNLEELKQYNITGPELAIKGINIYFEQVFDHGFFHADPHPGNIFILKDGRVCFIDYGMMGNIQRRDKEMLADLLLNAHNSDVQGLKKALLRFSSDEKAIDQKELEYDIMEFFSEYSNVGIEDIEGEEVIKALNSLFFDYKIRIPSNLLLLMKALVIIEGVGLTLDPRYNILENIHPFVVRLMEKKYSPKKLGSRFIKSLGDFTMLATSLPEDMQDVIKKVKQGKLHIEFEHTGLDPFYHKMDLVSNRIAFSVLIAALIIGSSVLVYADIAPHIYNVSAIGFGGFVIAGFLALRLAWAILKSGKI
ncbi:MAG: AarF/ABC1/UbiB kinase family protein [Saprospiraceae bacterium]|nr:AarF/ABC1/UbiB kinase family protein [Saprospiraceae bacterium]